MIYETDSTRFMLDIVDANTYSILSRIDYAYLEPLLETWSWTERMDRLCSAGTPEKSPVRSRQIDS